MGILKQRKVLLVIAGAIMCGLLILLGMLLINKNTLELNVSEGEQIHFEYGSDEKALGIEAVYKGTIFNVKGTSVKVQIKGDVDYTTLGEYPVKVYAEYKKHTAEAEVTIIVEDTLPPVIELVSDPEHFTNPSASYEEEGFLAMDNHDGDITKAVERKEQDGIVVYTVTDSSGNRATVERTIVYKDVIAPVITLNGEAEVSVNVGSEYEEPGFTATDECDGDISASVVVEGSVDCMANGVYSLTYKVTDSSGNEGSVTRNVKVSDMSAPVIKLSGDSEVYVRMGDSYTESGYTATDNADGDVTSKVAVSGTVDTKKSGSYTITYKVTDSSGNTASVSRNIYVYEKQAENVVVNPGDKVIYLTFDDGPGKYTEKLLDILDKYGVKVTFFVSGQFPKYEYLIGEAYQRGHTIGLHTFSHKYNEIYSSTDAYYKDLSLINDIVQNQTGEKPWLLRFPGGTGNTISKKYCTGIMSSIAEGVGYRGYLYCDWNIDSQDAVGKYTKNELVQNVINGVKKRNVSIVLQHDLYENSVEAVEEIICWGLSNGYKFLPLEETSPMVQQKISN